MELVKKEDNLLGALSEIENTKKMCDLLMKTPHYSKIGPEGIFALIAKANSLGINPIDALNGALYYVNGRVGMSTELMAARMRQAGHSITRDPKSNNSTCILHGKRKDTGDSWTTSFSIEDAKRAGIYNERGTWGKYPDVMCYNRAMSKMFRQLTPDLSKNAGYTLDELNEIDAISSEIPSPEPKIEEVKCEEIVEDVSNDQVEEIVEVISKEQVKEILSLFEECDPEYISSLWKTLTNPPIAIERIEQLPSKYYERIKAALLKNKLEYLSNKNNNLNKNLDENITFGE